MQLNEYQARVDELLLQEYCVSWNDACGDEATLLEAMDNYETPEEFVERFALKYDLDKC